MEIIILELVQALMQSSNGPPFELVSHCVVIPPGIPPEPSSRVFEDAVQKEDVTHLGMLDIHFNEINCHLTFDL